MKNFKLPDPGEGLVEADIVTWRVAEGDQVKVNDIVVEVETSKSLVELPIPFAGTVAKLLVSEGDTVEVGAPIITIDDGTGTPPDPAAPSQPESKTPESKTPESETSEPNPSGRVAVLVGYGAKTTEAKRRPRKGADQDAGTGRSGVADSFATDHPAGYRSDERHPLSPGSDAPVGAPLPGPGAPPSGHPAPELEARPLAKPPVRKRAKDLGLDLATVTGSGEGGVITRDDVEKAALRQAQGADGGDALRQAQGADGGSRLGVEQRIPIKGVRKSTAQAMVSSAFTAPHVSVWLTCDVTATMDLVAKLKTRREFAEVRVSPLLIIAKAVCLALARTRELNSAWDEAAQEIVLHGGVNLGIAAATPRGLVVPNVKNAEAMSLLELGTALSELVGTARSGKTQPAQLSGGTFSITNVGPLGVDAGTPILNPGEAGILCVGVIDRRPWVRGTGADERIEPRWVTTLALSFDHRLADGEQGSRFLVDVADILRDPGMALLH